MLLVGVTVMIASLVGMGIVFLVPAIMAQAGWLAVVCMMVFFGSYRCVKR